MISGDVLSFDFNTLGVKGLGRELLEETFKKYGDEIKHVQVEWFTNSKYPGGKSKGLHDFWKYKELNPKATSREIIKNSALYQLLEIKGFTNISTPLIGVNKNSVVFTLSR